MARFDIYSKGGKSVRYTGEPQYSGSYMGVDYVEFRTIVSPTPIEWEIGDYVDYHRTGLRYKLYSLPMPNKVARRGEYGAAFEYSNVKFYAATKELEIAPFRDLVPKDNQIHFSTRQDVSTYENVHGVAERIQVCMDDLYPNKWRIEVYEGIDADLNALMRETKAYSVSNGSCLDALSEIYNLWKNVGWIHTYDATRDVNVITIGRANVRDTENTSKTFSYGVGNGLTSIRKATANEGEFATRLYVYGSERNIQTRYYNNFNIVDKDSVDIRNLMLPISSWGKTNGKPDASKAYLQADASIIEKYGLIPRTVYFDGNENEEIYPSIVGLTMSDVRKAMIEAGEESSPFLPADFPYRIDRIGQVINPTDNGTQEEVEKKRTFEVTLLDMGFNVAEQGKLTSEGYAIISMKSGACAGREFKVKKFSGKTTSLPKYGVMVYELERTWDESLGMGFPNNIYPINEEDEFVLLDIPMPDYYVTLAAKKLLEAGQKMLADYTRVSAFYEPSVDAIQMKVSGEVLRAGMYMQVYDEDIIDTEDNKDYVLIDTLTIDEKSQIPTYRVTLREQKRSARTYSALEDMIVDAKADARDLIKKERQYTDRRFRSSLETLELIQNAFENYTDGISPATIKTVALLIGDESLQFKFVSTVGEVTVNPGFSYNTSTKVFSIARATRLVHMTLGIDEVTSKDGRAFDDYLKWNMPSWESTFLEDGTKSYYLYARVPKDGTSGKYILEESAQPLETTIEDKSYYNFLVGILNSELADKRDFITLYGFTEVLPGQITTDVIRSTDGSCYFDLANNEIGGIINFAAGSKGVENLNLGIGGENLLRNSGFTGDYLSETLADNDVLEATKQLYSDPLDHWTTSGRVGTQDAEGVAVSGKAVVIPNNASISQELYYDIIVGQEYILSFKAKGNGANLNNLRISFGGTSETVMLTEEWQKYTVKFVPISEEKTLLIQRPLGNTSAYICDLKLEKGNIATEWSASSFDNSSDRTYYQSLKYLQDALANGSTTIGGGLVLTKTIVVGNYKDNEMVQETGGISGTWTDDESLFAWAGGTYQEAVNAVLENGEKEASFVVTHGGKVILNDAKVRGEIHAQSGSFGDFVIDGLYAKSSHTDTHGCKWGDSLYESWFEDMKAQMNSAGFTDVDYDNVGHIQHGFKTNLSYFADPDPKYTKFSFYAKSGMIGGMRPALRLVTGTGTSASPLKIYDADHTLVLYESEQRIYLQLPTAPKDGQELVIYAPFGARIDLKGDIFDMEAGANLTSWYWGGTNSRKKVSLVYVADLGMWILEKNYEYGA